MAHNHCEDIQVLLGDASLLGKEKYDIILANINRNILLNDIPTYIPCLNEGGLLFLSGFYDGKDLELLRQCCEEHGMQYVSHKVMDNWVAAQFRKIQL